MIKLEKFYQFNTDTSVWYYDTTSKHTVVPKGTIGMIYSHTAGEEKDSMYPDVKLSLALDNPYFYTEKEKMVIYRSIVFLGKRKFKFRALSGYFMMGMLEII